MVSLKMRCFSRMFDEVIAWGSLFHFLRSEFVCRPYFPVCNPPGGVLSPFQGSRCNGGSNRGLHSFHSLTPGYELAPFQGLRIYLGERICERRLLRHYSILQIHLCKREL